MGEVANPVLPLRKGEIHVKRRLVGGEELSDQTAQRTGVGGGNVEDEAVREYSGGRIENEGSIGQRFLIEAQAGNAPVGEIRGVETEVDQFIPA